MRAAVLHAPLDLRVEDRPDPTCGPGEVVLEVTYNGLGGTDATEYTRGPMMVPLTSPHPGSGHVGPTTLGHEFIGVVVDAGPGAEPWLGRRGACAVAPICAPATTPLASARTAASRGTWRPRSRRCARSRTAALMSRPRLPSRSR